MDPYAVGFAQGGFVTSPTKAMVGEGGENEYVIPADKMSSALSGITPAHEATPLSKALALAAAPL